MATELIVYNNNSTNEPSVTVHSLRGVDDIVDRMIRLTRSTMFSDKGFEVGIKQLLTSHGYNRYTDPATLFKFIFNYVHDNIAYVLDPAGSAEYLKNARQTLSDGFGDCDDFSVLFASILGIIGFEKVSFVLGRYSATEEGFSHVYTVCYADGERYVFDPCIENGEFNDERKAVLTKEFPVFAYNPQTDSVIGTIKAMFSTFSDLSKQAVKSAPELTRFAPLGLGFLARSAFNVGVTTLSGLAEAPHQTYAELASAVSRQLDTLLRQLKAGQITIERAKSSALKSMSRIDSVKDEQADTLLPPLRLKLNAILNFENSALADGTSVINFDKATAVRTGAVVVGAGLLFLLARDK